MAQHPTECKICDELRACQRGDNERLILEMETGWAVLGASQYFLGYSLLLCKTPVADLEELPPSFRLQYLAEMALLSQAVSRVVRPHKMNLESLGNQVPHLHWHVFPRQSFEASPEQPVWLTMPDGDAALRHHFDPVHHIALRDAIREELSRLLAG